LAPKIKGVQSKRQGTRTAQSRTWDTTAEARVGRLIVRVEDHPIMALLDDPEEEERSSVA
jgi:hypothetical protein